MFRTILGALVALALSCAPVLAQGVTLAPIKGKTGVTLDVTGKTVTGPLNVVTSSDVTIIGGTWDGGGVLDNAISIDNRGLAGPHKITVKGGVFKGYLRAAIKVTAVDTFWLTGNDFSAMGSDGISIGLSRNGTISGNTFHDFTSTPLAHADAIQFVKALPANDNMTVAGNRIDGTLQGVFGAADNIAVNDNWIRTPFANAIYVTGVGTAALNRNAIVTADGATTQARITTATYASVIRCGNTVAAWGRFPSLADPECARPPPPLSAEAQAIADLTARLAAAAAANDNLIAANANLKSQLDAATATNAALFDTATANAAKIEAFSAAVSAAQAALAPVSP